MRYNSNALGIERPKLTPQQREALLLQAKGEQIGILRKLLAATNAKVKILEAQRFNRASGLNSEAFQKAQRKAVKS